MSHLVCDLFLLILVCYHWNRVVCKSKDTRDGFLVFSNGNAIESIHVGDENATGPPVYNIENDKYIRKVVALTFDYEGERLFYSDIYRAEIQTTFLNGTNIRVVVKDVAVEDLVYEGSGSDLYFTSFTASSISKINVNDALNDVTIEPKVIIQQKKKEHPRAIIIENCFKFMYWTTWNDRPSIRKATLTGKDVQDIIITDIVFPNGLTIDHTTNKLYWSDAKLDKIEKCDMDGSNRVIISSISQHSFGLAVLGNNIFWTDWVMRAVIRINKVDGTGLTRVRDSLNMPFGILAIDRQAQKCLVDECRDDNYGCQDVCKTDFYGRAYCQCTYGILDTDGKTCKVVTQIIKPPENQRIVKGKTAILHCGVSQYAKIDVTWKWTYRRLNWNIDEQIFSDYRHSISVDGTLIIKGVTKFDIGKYTCTVASLGGNDEKTAELTVIEVPQAPVISSVALYPDDERAAIVKWVKGYNGNTPITRFLIEYKEVSEIYGNKAWVTFDSDIQPDVREAAVTDLRPTRTYQFRVTASNEAGDGSPSYLQPDPPLLMPQLPPSCYPKDIYGMPSTNSSIALFWQHPDKDSWNSLVLGGYTIQYKHIGSLESTFQKKTVKMLTGQNNMKYELQGLDFYQEYDIQIAAYNEKGVGVFSPFIKVATLEGHPIAPVKGLSLNVLNSTAVLVMWTPPNQRFINGKILGYKVFTITLDREPRKVVTSVPHAPTNSLQQTSLLNLKPHTVYEILVLCYTSQGDGPQSVPQIVVTAEDVPSQVGRLDISDITEELLKVTWKPPTEPNGILIGYTLLYWMKNESNTQQKVDLPPSALTYTLFRLSPMTIYTISVFASTSVGNGPPRSINVESWVPKGYPLPPSNLAVLYIDARSVVLQFLPGFDGGNPLSSFHIEAMEGNITSEWKTIHIHKINNLPTAVLTIEDLKPDTDYKLRIKAENSVGQSFPSESTRTFKTLQDVPETPPECITVRAINATALRITWMPLSKSDWNGELQGYMIYYKHKDTVEDFQTIDVDTNTRKENIIIGGLRVWTQYEVAMTAYNDVGYSRKSSIVLATTMESVPSEGPQNVQAIALSSTSVNVSWSDVPNLYQNGLILGYKVEYKSPLSNISSQYQDVPGQTANHVILENLQKFVLYEIRVLAYTRMGDGVLSYPEIIVKTMGDTPGPPSSVWFPNVSYYEVTIEWQPPLQPRGLLTGYRLAYKLKENRDEYITNSYISSYDTNYTVLNLHKEALYEFRLTARSHVDWGETLSVDVYTAINRGAPPQPLMPRIDYSSIEARSISISWVQAIYNIYSPIRNYTIQYKSQDNNWRTVLEPVMSSLDKYEVKGLRPDTEYVFRVAASNDIGTSPFSLQSYHMFTLEDYPEGAPQNVFVERLTRTSVKVSWQEPLSSTLNGKLLGYVLMYRVLGDTKKVEVEVSNNSNQKIIHNLAEFFYYQFLVTAFNRIGRGPLSSTVTVFVGEAPPSVAPVNIETFARTSAEIQISWLPPPLEAQNGDLLGYKVLYWRSKDPESTAEQVTTEENAIVLADLDIYTEYGIRVQAINNVGEGPMSEARFETTLEELPGKPASIKFWNVTYTSLDVQWEPPKEPNGKIIKYELTYQEQNPARESQEVKLEVTGDIHQLNIKDVCENATYLFRISASTSIGEGKIAEERVIIGPQTGSPEAPYQLKYSFKENGRKLILEWKSGAEGQLPINEHEIQAKRAYACNWKTVKKIGSNTSTKLNLNMKPFKPETRYRLRVLASNSYGVSSYSTQSEEFKTPESLRFLMFSASYHLEALDIRAKVGEDPVMFTIRSSSNMHRVIGLAFDYKNQRIFYSNMGLSSKKILAITFDGTEEGVVVKDKTGTVEDLAFEKISGDIYFTSFTNSCIGKLNVHDALSNKSRDPEIIVQLSKEDRPRGIVVDSCFKSIYWTNWNQNNPRIQSSNLNGGDVKDLITKDIQFPNNIVIDHTSKTLYWTDAGTDTIERCNLDGSKRAIVMELKRSHPYGLTVYGKYLFWTDWLRKTVMRAGKIDGGNLTIIRQNLSHTPMGIIAVADDSEDCTINKCYGDNHGCEDICYTGLSGEQSCECSSGILNSDQKTCSCK